MYKFGFNFFKILFQFAPCMRQSKIIPGQIGLNKKDKDITQILFLKPKLIHKHQNSELRILFHIIHEDCNKLVIVTLTKITIINGKKYETKYIILFNKKKL